MNTYVRTSLFGAALSLVLLAACSSPEQSSDPTETAGADLTKTPSPAPTIPNPLPTATGTGTSPSPPVPKPPGTCSGGGFGNAKGICTPDAQMLASAEADCGDSKLLITTFSPDEACGAGSSNSATFTCCPREVTPPPPPPACTEGGFANGNGLCESDAQMKTDASASCASQGKVLTTFTPDEKCGKGSSNSATFTCCAGASPG